MISKPYHSPHQVTFDDLIDVAERRLQWLRANRKVGWHYTHEIAVQEKIVALLKKFKKNQQLNLLDEFEKMKK